MRSHQPSKILRLALVVDALASGASGLLLLFGAGLVAPWLALPEALLRAAGLILVPFVAFVAVLALRSLLPVVAIYAVIAGNLLWIAASALLLGSGLVAPSPLGYAFVIAQAAAVAVFAEMQLVGVRRGCAVAA